MYVQHKTELVYFHFQLFWNRNDLDSGLYEGHVTGRKLFGGTQVPHGQGSIYYFQVKLKN